MFNTQDGVGEKDYLDSPRISWTTLTENKENKANSLGGMLSYSSTKCQPLGTNKTELSNKAFQLNPHFLSFRFSQTLS